jgi:hypothetical protein
MQSGVFAFLAIDMNGYLLGEMHGLAVSRLKVLEISRKDVFDFTRGHALGEFAPVVGVDLPTDFLRLIGLAADFHRYAIDGPVIRTPHGPGDHGVRFIVGPFPGEHGIGGSNTEENEERQ